jgi:hypothetical protein
MSAVPASQFSTSAASPESTTIRAKSNTAGPSLNLFSPSQASSEVGLDSTSHRNNTFNVDNIGSTCIPTQSPLKANETLNPPPWPFLTSQRGSRPDYPSQQTEKHYSTFELCQTQSVLLEESGGIKMPSQLLTNSLNRLHSNEPISLKADAGSDIHSSSTLHCAGNEHDLLYIPPRRKLPFSRSSTSEVSPSGSRSQNKQKSTLHMPPPSFPRSKTAMSATAFERTQPSARPHSAGRGTEVSGGPLSVSEPPQMSPSRANVTHIRSNPCGSDIERALNPMQTMAFTVESQANVASQQDNPNSLLGNRVRSELGAQTKFGRDGQLQSYASQPREDRLGIINQWMIEHINDDDFVVLCEDVWGCWSRIGLGL